MRFASVILLMLTLTVAGTASASLPVVVENFRFETTPPVIKLQEKFIISSSLSVTANGSRLSPDEYELDVPSGSLKLTVEFELPVEIVVSYSHLWFEPPSYYFKRKISFEQNQNSSQYRLRDNLTPPSLKRRADTSNRLRVFGSKSVGIQTGTGSDLELNQTMNIQIDGYLTDNLKVSGVLSDQSVPQTGGISTTLEEVDKVTLRLSSDVFTANLGDIDFDRRFGPTARFKKSIKGGSAAIHTNRVRSQLTLGGIKSKNATLRTSGRDGVSGPYRVFPNAGQSTVSILPGTDKVWLDGQLMTRGSDADYQIDYLLGEITFSPTVTITSNSRIEIDYEYLNENYRQDIYSGSFVYGDTSSGNFVGFDFIRQQDSKGSPSQFDLLPEDITLLEGAGDNLTNAFRSGVTAVDSGEGRYSLHILDGDSVFVFVGSGQGDYNVNFSFLGEGEGDYRYLGGGVYEYVSPGGGSYLPVVLLPSPEVSDAFGVSSNLSSGAFGVSVAAIVSDHDLNQFSGLDDNDNTGADISGEINIKPFTYDKSSYMGWDINLSARRIDNEFYLPGRAFAVERNRMWGLPSDSVFDLSEELSVGQHLVVGKILTVQGGYGVYEDRGYFDAARYDYDVVVKPNDRFRFRYARNDRIADNLASDFDSRLLENEAEAKWRFKDLQLEVGWNDELDLQPLETGINGRRFDRYRTGLTFGGLSAFFRYTDNELKADGWSKENDSREFEVSYRGSGGLPNSSANVSFKHRRVHYLIPEKYNQSQLLSALSWRAGSSSELFDVSLDYRISREGADRTSESFVRVGEGEGDYRFEDGIYVADVLGDYIKVVEVIGTDQVGVNLNRGLTLYTRFANWRNCPRDLEFLRALSLETRIRSTEQGGADESFNARWLLPHLGVFPDKRTLFEENLSQIARIKLARSATLYFSFNERRSVRPYQTPSGDDYSIEFVERGEFTLSPQVLYSIEHRFKRQDQNSTSFGDADFIEHQVGNTIRYSPVPRIELVFRPSYLIDKSSESDLTVTMWEAGSEASYSFPSRGRASVRFTYQGVSSSGSETFIPYQFAGGSRLGDNYRWGVTAEIRFTKHVSVNMSYDGQATPGLDTRHLSSASVRARF